MPRGFCRPADVDVNLSPPEPYCLSSVMERGVETDPVAGDGV